MQIKTHISDHQLIEDYKRTENPAAIETLFLRYSHSTFLVCYKYLRNEEESNDSVMEIFEKLLIDCKKYNILNFRSWLYTVTKNHCLMKIRESSKMNVYSLPSDEIDKIIVENSVLENHIDEENIHWDILLDRLSKEQKLCVELFYLREKSYKEIAQSNGMDISEVKSHIQNGKRNLKNLLAGKAGGIHGRPS